MAEAASLPAVNLGEVASGLHQTCVDYLAAHNARLRTSIDAGRDGVASAAGLSAAYDGLLGTLFCGANAAAGARGVAPDGRYALVAVGGYGRQLVGPHSDVDVLFLCDHPEDPRALALAESVVYPLWDLGVDVSQAVRGVDETVALSRSDIRTATTLLDARHLAGDRSIVAELLERGRRDIFDKNVAPFFDALEEDTVARHKRFGGSVYLLEPDIKHGRGALRDLDIVMWIAAARWNASTLEDASKVGALRGRELEELTAAREHFWRVRNLLHVHARRRHDRLTYPDQERIAAKLGYADGKLLGVEQFMQAHYRHARVIAQTVDWIGQRARRSQRPIPHTIRDLGDGVLVHDAQITLRDYDLLRQRPTLALRVYDHAIDEHLPVDPAVRDRTAELAAEPDWSMQLRADAEACRLFLELLAHADVAPVGRGSLAAEMHELGLVNAMIPEFGRITGRVQHDEYHVYTVDVHSIRGLDRLHELRRGELAVEYPTQSRVAAEIVRPLPLCLGILLHDIGKADGHDHARRGAELARPVAKRLGLSPADVDHVQWLVREHLSLYHGALRRDLADPATIADIARHVQNRHRLNDLFLLTAVDRSTTRPSEMTEWKARMLQEILTSVGAYLDAGSDGFEAQVQTLRTEALELTENPQERAELDSFLGQLPDRYVLATAPADMRIHLHHGRCLPGESKVHARHVTNSRGVELLVATDDRAGLLADLTAVLAASRFSIDAAQLYSMARSGACDQVFDIFEISHPHMGDDSVIEQELERLCTSALDMLEGRISGVRLLERRSKPPAWSQRKGPKVTTKVNVDNAASTRYTVIDVFTRDRDELLHAIARALHERGLSIVLAKVSTEGVCVADVFYVERAGGGKVSGPGELTSLAQALRDTIRQLDEA